VAFLVTRDGRRRDYSENVVGISTWSLVHEAEESKKYFLEKKL
jgi:hypothetical protein